MLEVLQRKGVNMSRIKQIKRVAILRIILAFLVGLPWYAKEATASDEQEVIESYNKTALQLYRQLGEESRNLVISPYSIGTTMAMALTGARGDTEKEMSNVLNQTIPRQRMDSANANILDKMTRFENERDITLSTANALCLTTHGGLVDPSYKKVLHTDYAAEIFGAQDVGPINAWVAKMTDGKIEKILDKLSVNSVCVLLNAVYFKGIWASQFDKELTRVDDFYIRKDKTVSVPIMHQTADYSLVKHDDLMALAMPYKVDSLAMVIVLPNDRMGLARLEKKLTMNKIHSVLKDLEESRPKKVMLSLPKFKIEFGAELIPAFRNRGMKLAFSSEKADFGGITGRDKALGLIWISQIKHKAFLEVNEEGSEAAASTAVEFITKSVPRITQFQVDHPFFFFLVDKETKAIMFMGRVNNPQKGD